VWVVWRDKGALMHVRQSLRWRDFKAVLEGAFIVQFFLQVSECHFLSLFG
jgi:hypothetical protein